MGASLVTAFLKIEKGKTPNWAAAYAALASMPDETIAKFLRDNMGNNDLNLEEVNEDNPNPEKLASELAQGLEYLTAALNSIKEGMRGEHTLYNLYTLEKENVVLLVTGERTWGDPCDEVEYILALKSLGVTEAAGFI